MVVDARQLSDAELAGCIDELGSARDANLRVVPIFIDRGHRAPRSQRHRLRVGDVGTEWMDLGVVPEYEEYVRGRLEAAVSRYGAADVVPLNQASRWWRVCERSPVWRPLETWARRGRRAYRLALPCETGEADRSSRSTFRATCTCRVSSRETV